eukprot:g4096.t1
MRHRVRRFPMWRLGHYSRIVARPARIRSLSTFHDHLLAGFQSSGDAAFNGNDTIKYGTSSMRSLTIGSLCSSSSLRSSLVDSGKEITLTGWVQWPGPRDMGSFAFLTLRDGLGTIQLSSHNEEQYQAFLECSSGIPIQVKGKLVFRPKDQINHNLPSGDVEMLVSVMEEINTLIDDTKATKTTSGSENIDEEQIELPLPLLPETQSFNKSSASSSRKKKNISELKLPSEEKRLKYRYLDLRRGQLQRNLRVRSAILQGARYYLSGEQGKCIEVETPTLFKATPEGAREFLVPSRKRGKFYALPQSPQQYKQLLMVGGIDRYFQVARCYRDEDGRSDRQPEFTQIDIECAWIEKSDIMRLVEGLVETIINTASLAHNQCNALQIGNPINIRTDVAQAIESSSSGNECSSAQEEMYPRMTYAEALMKYGIDKPDLRRGTTWLPHILTMNCLSEEWRTCFQTKDGRVDPQNDEGHGVIYDHDLILWKQNKSCQDNTGDVMTSFSLGNLLPDSRNIAMFVIPPPSEDTDATSLSIFKSMSRKDWEHFGDECVRLVGPSIESFLYSGAPLCLAKVKADGSGLQTFSKYSHLRHLSNASQNRLLSQLGNPGPGSIVMLAAGYGEAPYS